MDVAALSPLPVGALAWNAPEPTYTVIVKATFSLPATGAAVLLQTQPPLSLDQPLGEGDEVRYGTDFAPRKRRVDLLVVGQARAATPRAVIPICVAVGNLRLAYVALSEEPRTRVPLLGRHLRRVADDPTTATRLAPVRGVSPDWGNHAVAADFDFSVFNVAPIDHHLDALPAGAPVVLEGLVGDGSERTIALPGLEPAVFHLRDRRATVPQVEQVAMRCDTLCIDTDGERLTLVWRGQVARLSDDLRQGVVVALVSSAAAIGWTDIAPQIHGAAWRAAVRPRDLLSQSAPASGAAAASSGSADAASRAATGQDATLPVSDLAPAVTLPFADGDVIAPKRIAAALDALHGSNAPGGTRALPAMPSKEPLPFDGAAPPEQPRAQPRVSPPAAARSIGGTTLPVDGGAPIGEAMPFRPPSQPAPSRAPSEHPEPRPASRPAPSRPPPQPAPSALAMGAPRVASVGSGTMGVDGPSAQPLPFDAAPPATDPKPVLSLETYAAIKAALWEADQQLAQVLDAHRVDETAWREHEREIGKTIAREACRGSSETAERIRVAIEAARRARMPEGEHTMALDDYAVLRAAVEDATDPAAILRTKGLSGDDWERLQRHYARRAKSDSTLAARLRERLAVARRALVEDEV